MLIFQFTLTVRTTLSNVLIITALRSVRYVMELETALLVRMNSTVVCCLTSILV